MRCCEVGFAVCLAGCMWHLVASEREEEAGRPLLTSCVRCPSCHPTTQVDSTVIHCIHAEQLKNEAGWFGCFRVTELWWPRRHIKRPCVVVSTAAAEQKEWRRMLDLISAAWCGSCIAAAAPWRLTCAPGAYLLPLALSHSVRGRHARGVVWQPTKQPSPSHGNPHTPVPTFPLCNLSASTPQIAPCLRAAYASEISCRSIPGPQNRMIR